MSSCLCHTLRGLKTPVNNHHVLKSSVLPSEGVPPKGCCQSVGWSYKSHKCKAVLVYCSAIIEKCCFYQLTSTLTTAATEEHQACGQIEIMSKTGPVLNVSPLRFSMDKLLWSCNNIIYISLPCFIKIHCHRLLLAKWIICTEFAHYSTQIGVDLQLKCCGRTTFWSGQWHNNLHTI